MSRYRGTIISSVELIKLRLNELLVGNGLNLIEVPLTRMSRGGVLPLWFNQLVETQTLPNLDGKTIGSVIEKLLACVLEKFVLDSKIKLHINPAKGVDIPELQLGIKSPSKNFCTSEPYFSAYERLVGNENDALILLTDYQSSKRQIDKNHGLKLQILDIKYLKGAEIADRHLCKIAESLKTVYARQEDMFRRAIHFLAYINQGDWEASRLLEMIQNCVIGDRKLTAELQRIKRDFDQKNMKNMREGKELIPIEHFSHIEAAATSQTDVILQAEGWVSRTLNENWHSPSQTVWQRILTQPLEGKIGMSFALQWRYNFASVFRD